MMPPPMTTSTNDDPPIDPTHLPTLRAIAAGTRALEASDYDFAQTAFKTATRRAAVEALAPGRGRRKIVGKCVAYALACGILRHARRLCEVLAGSIPGLIDPGSTDSGALTETGDSAVGPSKNPRIRPSIGRDSPWNDPTSHPRLRHIAVELARLGRHLAALPLDPTHRCAATRFAAVWNFRAGNRTTATAMLGSLVRYAGTIPKRVDLDFDLIAVVSCAVAAHARGATPFDVFDGGHPRPDPADGDGDGDLKSSIDENVPAGEDPALICAATLRTISSGTEARCGVCGATHGSDAAAAAGGPNCAVCDSPMA